MSPLDAARLSMDEVSTALIAIVLNLVLPEQLSDEAT